FAVAKADLGSDIKIDLDAAVRRLAAEGFALAPLVGRVGPLYFRESGMAWCCHRAVVTRHRPGEEHRGPGQRAQSEADDRSNDGGSFHRIPGRYRFDRVRVETRSLIV